MIKNIRKSQNQNIEKKTYTQYSQEKKIRIKQYAKYTQGTENDIHREKNK